MADTRVASQVLSTAGAVPVRNEKGELRMEKVKVTRYISGKRPAYAQESSSDESSSSEEEDNVPQQQPVRETSMYNEQDLTRDRRLLRLRERAPTRENEHQRYNEEPQAMFQDDSEDEREEEEQEMEEEEMETEKDVEVIERNKKEEPVEERRYILIDSDDESEDSEEEDDQAIDKRRELMKEKALQRQQEEILDVMDEEEETVIKKRESEEESSEYEEYSDSEDELGPRLKPVFIRKSDRVTVKDVAAQEDEARKQEKEKKIAAEKRKKESNRMIAEAIAHELQQEQGVDTLEEVVNTDEENEEEEYEAWKVRELQRIKRDREEIENRRKEREELERIRNMTEDERQSWLKTNPRVVTNQQTKGKYKFLQKYFHRGVFYLDEEDEVFKRDFAEPTLEDHFDKTVLPQVMQVKDFGRAGRTKYTHLVDQDTTVFDNAWSQSTPINLKYQSKGGGMKESFIKPSRKKQRTTD